MFAVVPDALVGYIQTQKSSIMKKSFVLLALLISTLSTVLAQAFRPALLAQISAANDAESTEQLREAANRLERIAATYPDAWLPQYHAANVQLWLHYANGEEGCETCLDKAWNFIDQAQKAKDFSGKQSESEILTLQASYYQAMLGLKPMRAPIYGPKAGKLLAQAIDLDSNNPRAQSLMGQNYYYTPAAFGGGIDKALPHMQKAVQLFEAEQAMEDRDRLLPAWGKPRAVAMLNQMEKQSKN